MLSELLKPISGLLDLLHRLVGAVLVQGRGVCGVGGWQDVQLSLSANFLFGAIASLLVALFYQRASAIFPANVHLCAVSTILAVKHV